MYLFVNLNVYLSRALLFRKCKSLAGTFNSKLVIAVIYLAARYALLLVVYFIEEETASVLPSGT